MACTVLHFFIVEVCCLIMLLFHCFNFRLIEAKHVVFECGPKCGCDPSCVNRTSQRGLKYRLEVFYYCKKD